MKNNEKSFSIDCSTVYTCNQLPFNDSIHFRLGFAIVFPDKIFSVNKKKIAEFQVCERWHSAYLAVQAFCCCKPEHIQTNTHMPRWRTKKKLFNFTLPENYTKHQRRHVWRNVCENFFPGECEMEFFQTNKSCSNQEVHEYLTALAMHDDGKSVKMPFWNRAN